MENIYSGSCVLRHCPIAAVTSSFEVNLRREMAESDNNQGMNQPRDESSSFSNRNKNIIFPAVPFSPVATQAEIERGQLPFHDALSLSPYPLNQAAVTKKQEGIAAQIMKEVQALSESERQLVENDVHGKNPTPLMGGAAGEAERLITVEVESLDRELRKLVLSHPAYQELIPALEYDYVKDAQLRSKMLRAEHYDCCSAALRLAKFLTMLQEAFGPALLQRPIQLIDLSAEERQLQRRGLHQLFKFRDHSGRRIVGCFDSQFVPTATLQSQLRVALYLMQVASDDEETQNQGLVFIFMLLNDDHLPSPPSSTTTIQQETISSSCSSRWSVLARISNTIFHCAPVRVGAMHICSSRGCDVEAAQAELVNEFGPNERLRSMFHSGTSIDISMALNGFGIPTDRLPLKFDGTVKIDDHLQWIAIREAKEEAFRQDRVFEVVECPMNMDILSGRGQLVRSHPGNVSFRQDFIQARSQQYNAAHSRDEKNDIALEIMTDVATMSRRFLKQHPSGYWTVLEPKVAKEKVMMAFREYRKSLKLEESRNNAELQQLGQQQQLQQPHSQLHHQQLQPYPQYLSFPPYQQYPSITPQMQLGNDPSRMSRSARRPDVESPVEDEPKHKRYKTGYD